MELPRSTQPLHVRQRVDQDLAGGELTIRGDTEIARRVHGDVTVTSGQVLVSGVITGSLFVVGGHVQVTGSVGGTVENLGGVVDVYGVVEGLVHGPRPSTRVAADAVVGTATPSAETTPLPVVAEVERYDSAGRWRLATGLIGVAAAISVTGFAIFGGNGVPSPNQALEVVVVNPEKIEVAGLVEYATSDAPTPLAENEASAEVARGLSLLDDLVIGQRSEDPVEDSDQWATPAAVDPQDCVPWSVLVTESNSVVAATTLPCEISGSWIDALSGATHLAADELTIAPIVPVANVVQSGGAAWDETTRKSYAADTSSPETLQTMAVALVGERDGRAPDQWRPADQALWCGYGLDWVSVKTRFGLTATTAEARTLRLMIDTCNATSSLGPNPVHSRADRPIASVGIDPDAEVGEEPAFTLPCDPSYPDVCIPPPPAAITCEQVGEVGFEVRGDDPHNFDTNGDGIGCDF